MLAEYISLGQTERAQNIINDPSVHDLTLTEITTEPEKCGGGRLIAEILRIKKAKTKRNVAPGKFQKVDKPYDRLVMLRFVHNVLLQHGSFKFKAVSQTRGRLVPSNFT